MKSFISLILFITSVCVYSQTKRIYTTQKINSAPQIDGVLDDECWKQGEWQSDFIQREPEDGTPPTEQTKFKILYDTKFLYFAIISLDSDPNKVVRRLSRRDGFEGDFVEVNIDSYYDLRTAFSFTITAAGVKGDEFISNNGNNWDDSWNPIWYAKTGLTKESWVAEFKIPLSQLRFSKSENQIWGLQVTRRFFRNEEQSNWQRIKRNAPGWVSEFGELHGLKDLLPQKQREIQPYLLTGIKTYTPEENNPFKPGSNKELNGGLDGKIGITNNLTLDFTINPDFGQVEADPSNIALDGFEIFFNERRPFFVENKNIFNFRIGRNNVFYSRRIGRSPQHSIDIEDDEYKDEPTQTQLLGAAKFSGKTENGWSIGFLEVLTSKEFATVENQTGENRTEVIEPQTNYTVTRIQKDFNDRNSYVGAILTTVNRELEGGLDFLHESAYVLGLDFLHQWNNRKYFIETNYVVSNVTGSKKAIKETQESIAHLFHREDLDYIKIDSTRTSLTGSGATLKFGKTSGGNINYEIGGGFYSPQFELNDIGFHRRSNEIFNWTWIGYRMLQPTKLFRNARVNLVPINGWDFDGNYNILRLRFNGFAQFSNNWNIRFGNTYLPINYSNTALRGGPRLKQPQNLQASWSLQTDSRKKLQLGTGFSAEKGFEGSINKVKTNFEIIYRPINALNISLSPSFTTNQNKLQYVDNIDTNTDTVYVNGTINQETFLMSFRLNYTINPNLTIQYWGQPFISTGKYSNFKYITDPNASSFVNRFSKYNSSQIKLVSNDYEIDLDENGTKDYSFDNPDFISGEFRSNLVLRWEYIPGSEIFLVWSQGLSSDDGNINNSFLDNFDSTILQNQPTNTFLIKAIYRLIL